MSPSTTPISPKSSQHIFPGLNTWIVLIKIAFLVAATGRQGDQFETSHEWGTTEKLITPMRAQIRARLAVQMAIWISGTIVTTCEIMLTFALISAPYSNVRQLFTTPIPPK